MLTKVLKSGMTKKRQRDKSVRKRVGAHRNPVMIGVEVIPKMTKMKISGS